MMKVLAIIGSGGHAKVVAEAAKLSGWGKILFFDDMLAAGDNGKKIAIQGTTVELLNDISQFHGVIIAIGDNNVRLAKYQLLLQNKIKLMNIIHPRAIIASATIIGPGTVIVAGAIINVDACIGAVNIINTGATIDHDCILGDGVHICPGVHLAGGVEVGTGSWIGIGASVKQSIKIGNNTIIGAGAIVVNDIPANVIAYGVPAKIVKRL